MTRVNSANVDASAIRSRYRQCELCPRCCGVDRTADETGVCGATDEMVIGRAALHFWEEPPLSGESGSGTIFFSSCSLRCVYCQNRVIAQGKLGRPIGELELAETMLSLQDEGALNINLVTGTHYIPTIVESVALARSRGLSLPIVWNTSSYESPDALRLLDGTVDVYLADYKYANTAIAKAYSSAPDYPEVALQAIRQMVSQVGSPEFDTYNGQERMVKGVIVRHLLLPGSLQDSLKAVEKLYRTFGDTVAYSFMNQYTPVLVTAADGGDAEACAALAAYPELAESVSESDYERLLDHADALGIEGYFWQEGGACEESFIPEFSGA